MLLHSRASMHLFSDALHSSISCKCTQLILDPQSVNKVISRKEHKTQQNKHVLKTTVSARMSTGFVNGIWNIFKMCNFSPNVYLMSQEALPTTQQNIYALLWKYDRKYTSRITSRLKCEGPIL